MVPGKNIGNHVDHLFAAREVQQRSCQQPPESFPLVGIGNHDCKLTAAAVRDPHQARDADDGTLAFGNQHHLPVVIGKADAGEPVMVRPRLQLDRRKVSLIHGPFGQAPVECNHLRLILGTDGAYYDLRAIKQSSRLHFVQWIGANGGTGQVGFRRVNGMQNNASVQGDQAGGPGEQRVDVNLLDPRLRNHKLAELDQQFLQLVNIHGSAAADAIECGPDPGSLHQTARQGGVQRRQSQGMVFVDLYKLASRTEEQHGAELRINAAAQNQFVAFQAHHGLNGDALKIGLGRMFNHRPPDVAKCLTHRSGAGQVELHSAHVGLMRNGL